MKGPEGAAKKSCVSTLGRRRCSVTWQPWTFSPINLASGDYWNVSFEQEFSLGRGLEKFQISSNFGGHIFLWIFFSSAVKNGGFSSPSRSAPKKYFDIFNIVLTRHFVGSFPMCGLPTRPEQRKNGFNEFSMDFNKLTVCRHHYAIMVGKFFFWKKVLVGFMIHICHIPSRKTFKKGFLGL